MRKSQKVQPSKGKLNYKAGVNQYIMNLDKRTQIELTTKAASIADKHTRNVGQRLNNKTAPVVEVAKRQRAKTPINELMEICQDQTPNDIRKRRL